MRNVELKEEDYLTPLESVRYWILSKNKFYDLINSGCYSFVVLYRKRKLILREEYGDCIMSPTDVLKEGKMSEFVSRNTKVEPKCEMSSKIA